MIVVIMKMASRTIVLLLSICYLGMSSLAFAHMPKMMDHSDGLKNSTDMAMSMEQPDCHMANDMAMDHEAVNLCQIFCSAIGQAVEVDVPSILATLSSPIQGPTSIYRLDSRHIQVEPHPPK